MTSKPKVIVLHGLFMSGLVMMPLCQRIKTAGFRVTNLSYNSRELEFESIFANLDQHIGNQPTVIVCHSLGGLVTRHYLVQNSPASQNVKAVITLGTPHQGSSIAHSLCNAGLEKLLKQSVRLLLPHNDQWQFDAKLFSVAGDLPLGLQPLLQPKKDSDGTVLLEETKLDGMTEHKTFPLTHLSMIYSRRVAAYVIDILNHRLDNGQATGD